MQTQLWYKVWPPTRGTARYVMSILVTTMLFALTILPALASGVNGSGN